jgi:hypothetical protein
MGVSLSGNSPEHDRLLYRVRVVAASVVLALLVYAVIVDRDISLVGMLVGALTVLLGIAGIEAFQRRNGA